jgi:hypothetical protein
VTPGQPFYPAEYWHVLEKYWDSFPRLYGHPDFSRETTFCQEQMTRFSEALSTMGLCALEPRVSAEADDLSVQVSKEAAISRLRPIQDGLDFCGVHGGTVTGSGDPEPGLAQTMF